MSKFGKYGYYFYDLGFSVFQDETNPLRFDFFILDDHPLTKILLDWFDFHNIVPERVFEPLDPFLHEVVFTDPNLALLFKLSFCGNNK